MSFCKIPDDDDEVISIFSFAFVGNSEPVLYIVIVFIMMLLLEGNLCKEIKSFYNRFLGDVDDFVMV